MDLWEGTTITKIFEFVGNKIGSVKIPRDLRFIPTISSDSKGIFSGGTHMRGA
jgi:hypothetical protein